MTVSQKSTFQSLIAQIKSALAVVGLKKEEKLFKVHALVRLLKEQNSDIYDIIQAKNISTWGSVSIFDKVVVVKQQSFIQTTIHLDHSKNCVYFDALKAAAQATGDSSCISAVNNLISNELIEIAENATLEYNEKIVMFSEKVQALFVMFSSFKLKIQIQEISGFGSFLQFFDIAKTYKQKTEDSDLSSGTFPNIKLIAYLQQSLEYWINVDINVAIQLNSFIQRVNQSFEQEVFTWEGRQKFLADYITEWMVFDYEFTCKYFLTIKFGDFGSLFDFIFCEHFEVEPEVTFAPEATTQVYETTYGSSLFTELVSSASSCSCVCE